MVSFNFCTCLSNRAYENPPQSPANPSSIEISCDLLDRIVFSIEFVVVVVGPVGETEINVFVKMNLVGEISKFVQKNVFLKPNRLCRVNCRRSC